MRRLACVFALAAVVSCSVACGPALASFGLEPGGEGFAFSAAEAPESPQAVLHGDPGAPDVQAGSHPWEIVTTFGFNQHRNGEGVLVPEGDVKDVEVALPPGLIGDTAGIPRCSEQLFHTQGPAPLSGQDCPINAQVGYAEVVFGTERGARTLAYLELPIFNLTPVPGEPAEYGFNGGGYAVQLKPVVRTGSDYGVTVVSHDTSQAQRIYGVRVVFWGVPADHSHDEMRGECLRYYHLRTVQAAKERGLSEEWTYPSFCYPGNPQGLVPISAGVRPEPLLTLPTSCAASALSARVRLDSWQEPERYEEREASNLDQEGKAVGLSGCGELAFQPQLTASPDTAQADTPAGLTTEVTFNQEGLTTDGGVAPATIKDTTVTLPEGVAVNPGQAAGLVVCRAAEDALGTEGAPSCPAASKVGTDEIQTPLLRDTLKGDVYVLASNPPHLQLLIAAAADGVQIKLRAQVNLNEVTGQPVTTLTETPPLPFTDFKLSFSGGAQAALVTPARCGVYSTAVDFTPWSSPFDADLLGSSSFAIASGPGGSACPGQTLPFAPAMVAGATTDQAGGYTNFSLLLQRGDGQQRIERLQFKTPPGLLGMISRVALCGEPQAAQGICPPSSQIGHTVVQSGPGPYPLVVPQPGSPPAAIYLTGPYDGAPFGLSIVTPVIAGPFNLGTIVTRAKIEVDPTTAQITVTTEPLPQMVVGVPTDLRTIDAVIDRPEFMFNPTSCNPMSFSGTAYGAPAPGSSGPAASAPIESHFQVGSCQSLAFKPSFEVSTSGNTSRANGASLDVKLSFSHPSPGQNGEANIHSVHVELPKALPARLTTLQKACTDTVFSANPASCPAASKIGSATATTPLLPVELSGPAYFVSHGGAKFPELIIVLSGYGVTVELHGETFIDKAGITSTTFNTVPDVPVRSFELQLPEGRYSALAANGDICATKLTMPTTFTAQNGAKIEEKRPISVEGCKPTIRVLHRSVRHGRATLVVSVPSAGTLTAGGNGLSQVRRTVRGAGTVTVTLGLSRGDQRFVARHHGRRLMAPVRLSFSPTRGKRLQAQVAVLMR